MKSASTPRNTTMIPSPNPTANQGTLKERLRCGVRCGAESTTGVGAM